MAEPRRAREPATEPPAVLGAGTEFEGLLVLRGPARLDGRLRGEVIASDTLWIGPGAEIEARVEAENVVVAGTLRGDVSARGRIALEASARVTGQLSAERLVLAEGSSLDGACHAGSPPDALRRSG